MSSDQLSGVDEVEYEKAVAIFRRRETGKGTGLPLGEPGELLSIFINSVWILRNESGVIVKVATPYADGTPDHHPFIPNG